MGASASSPDVGRRQALLGGHFLHVLEQHRLSNARLAAEDKGRATPCLGAVEEVRQHLQFCLPADQHDSDPWSFPELHSNPPLNPGPGRWQPCPGTVAREGTEPRP